MHKRALEIPTALSLNKTATERLSFFIVFIAAFQCFMVQCEMAPWHTGQLSIELETGLTMPTFLDLFWKSYNSF